MRSTTSNRPPSIRTSQIYWGAIPWLFMQLILVVVVIMWPEAVTYWISAGSTVDPSTIELNIPQMDASPLGPPQF